MAEKSNTVRTIGGVIVIVAFLAGIVAFAIEASTTVDQNTELIAQNYDVIREVNASLAKEIGERKEADSTLSERIGAQAVISEKGFSELQVKLSQIETKLDTNLTYLIKAIDRLED